MTRPSVPPRPAGFALGLLVLSIGGCAHFRNAEVRAQERAGVQRPEPPFAQTVPPPPMSSEPAPPPPPVPVVVPPAPPAPPEPRPVPAQVARPVAVPRREPAPVPRVAVRPVLSAIPAPTTSSAIIIFANIPAANCGSCDTLKISIAPSGQVLIERGAWTAGHGNWHYKRSRANVGPDRAAAFASSLSTDRPVGNRTIGTGCAAPASGDDGLLIEWIEADRDDRLTARFACTTGGAVAERLRHAPDLLGLRNLAFP